MEIDKNVTWDRFSEVVAKALDIQDQNNEGRYPPHDHDRWEKRYHGTPWDELPRGMIEFNHFRPMVDLIVSNLMMALDDDDWKRGKSPVDFDDKARMMEMINITHSPDIKEYLLNSGAFPDKDKS